MLKSNKKVIHNRPNRNPALRLWPGVVIVILQLILRFGASFEVGILAGIIGYVALVIWWVFFSRAATHYRWSAVILMAITLAGTWFFRHESMGPLWFFGLVFPVLSLAFVAWAVISHRFSERIQRVSMIVTILFACGFWLLLQTNGVTGDYRSDFMWRWTETAEERLLSQLDQATTITSSVENIGISVDWPGFRGAQRDGKIHGTQINTDWSSFPPEELWRRPVGPGWSSFSVAGGVFYTQEQLGDDEIVSCYKLATGESVWKHRDNARFFESNSGAGPRSTPTLNNDLVVTLGATGILNVLNASDGTVVWTRNAAADTQTKVPYWGCSGSPLVLDDKVIVAISGSFIAYDLSTGNPIWKRIAAGDCYSSPHEMTLHNISQIMLLNEAGLNSINPIDGSLLWEYLWKGNPIVQPALMPDGDLLISVSQMEGLRRISIDHDSDGWSTKEQWTSLDMGADFNDFVVNEGFIYGYDGPNLVCINAKNGTRLWKGSAYGGQLILLADQAILLLLTEKGNLVLVSARPDQFTELASLQALKGKTWNHPVLIEDVLLVRNAQEMAAFKLPTAGI